MLSRAPQDGAVTERTEDHPGPPASTRVTTAHLCDVSPMGILMDPGIRAIWPGAQVEGRAFTVMTPPGDNASLMVALREAEAGDVLVGSILIVFEDRHRACSPVPITPLSGGLTRICATDSI